ncbi:endo alpha-1,4 polygalactosaminidase [Butyrivibrio sp. WCD3002]|uniref:endo alpha-1,4 polygalactosaminidase n=2 Tax=Butyrivibrio sp. WCD3002 TaxID=1280676 RepID=UPI000410E2E6|nr:endo alpha-1,4 polygalactosaminidase [Butyrivibrio sp. WCD3002]
MRKRLTASVLALMMLVGILAVTATTVSAKKNFANDYGVFLSLNSNKKTMKKLAGYRTVVIDAQNDFTKEDIRKLRKAGHKVYSYINVGAIENYRDYYDNFRDVMLDVYENWEDERWVDVSQKKWQDFILNDLSVRIKATGVDGFFVDNVDVYYMYRDAAFAPDIYNGLEIILKGLSGRGKVIINGGDTFVSEYYDRNGSLDGILDGVNQESVFTSIIDYDKNKFGESDKDSREYFTSYLKKVKKCKKKVYLLEYTKNKKLKKKIRNYCKKKGYSYYISGNLNLS